MAKMVVEDRTRAAPKKGKKIVHIDHGRVVTFSPTSTGPRNMMSYKFGQQGLVDVLDQLAPHAQEKSAYADKNSTLSSLASTLDGNSLASLSEHLTRLLFPWNILNIPGRNSSFPFQFNLCGHYYVLAEALEEGPGADQAVREKVLHKANLPTVERGGILTCGALLDSTEKTTTIVQMHQLSMLGVALLRSSDAYPLSFPAVLDTTQGPIEAIAVLDIRNSELITFPLYLDEHDELIVHPDHTGIFILTDDAALSLMFAVSGELRANTLAQETSERWSEISPDEARDMTAGELQTRIVQSVSSLDVLDKLSKDVSEGGNLRTELLTIQQYFLRANSLWDVDENWFLGDRIEAASYNLMSLIATTTMMIRLGLNALGPEVEFAPRTMRKVLETEMATLQMKRMLVPATLKDKLEGNQSGKGDNND